MLEYWDVAVAVALAVFGFYMLRRYKHRPLNTILTCRRSHGLKPGDCVVLSESDGRRYTVVSLPSETAIELRDDEV